MTSRGPENRWISNLPEDWSIARVSHLAEVVPGFPFNSTRFSHSEGYPLIRIRDLASTETAVRYDGPWVEKAAVDSGDILIGMDGDFNCVRWKGSRALLNQRLCVVKPENEALGRLLSYALPTPLNVINALTFSTTVKHLSIGEVRRVRVPVPPQKVATRIADFLDRETAYIDSLIEKKERLLSLLEEKRSALITQAVTKGLDPEVPMKDSGVEWIGEIPEHWDVVPAGRLFRDIEQGWSPVADDRPAEPSEWAVIKLSAIKGGVFIESEHKTLPKALSGDPRLEIREGDLLVTRANTPELVADVCVVQAVRPRLMISDLVYRVQLRATSAVPEYLAYWLLSDAGRTHVEVEARGSSLSMVKVSQRLLKSWPCVLPPRAEQREIEARLKHEETTLREIVSHTEKSISLLRERRSALITAAVTGQIDVSEYAA